ncbi:MAG TPA: hypothetical protein VEM36_03500 [Xanthobacteraceae bacterium]|nr:hypothetical protein [Xanthobacteraceae bacterium]
MEAAYLRTQASRCYRLARECYDLAVAHELNEMGNEFRAKARDLEHVVSDQEGIAAHDYRARDRRH